MQICIIGGGVVGLNAALHLAEDPTFKGTEIFLLEKEKFLGHHTSTRNSEVIHAGFAYPPDSLKTKLCIEGNRLTYELLQRLNVPHKKCGKWVFACGEPEDKALTATLDNARICGTPGIALSSLERFYKEEPSICNVTSVAFSETSGIMDAAAYIRALEVELSKHSNVNVIYPCKVTGVDKISKMVETDRGEIQYDVLINAAGLWADDIYNMCCRNEDFQMCSLYQIVPFKGEYYTWRKGTVKTMIYPVPSRFIKSGNADATLVSSMGVHTHRNMAGELLVGPSQIKGSPDKKDDYNIVTPPEDFVKELSKFLKDISAADLEPAYAGNRPKLYKSGHPAGDFQIFKESGILHMMGMESPALTAAPAIARYLAGMIG